MIKAVVVDDHKLFADGLAEALSALPDINTTATYYDGSELLAESDYLRADVIIIDLEMPEIGGLATLGTLDNAVPALVVSMHTGAIERQKAIDLGAAAFLPKSSPLSDLAAAIRAVHAGEDLTDPTTFSEILSNYSEPTLDPGADSLTSREKDLLRLLARGVSTTDELADMLYISQKTVKNHLANIYVKLAVADRAQAAVEAIRLGLHRE